MLRNRALVILVLLPAIIAAVWYGGWLLTAFWALALAIAAWEYAHMYQQAGLKPSAIMLMIGCAGLVVTRMAFGIEGSAALLSFLIMASAVVHLFAYETGDGVAGTSLATTIAGLAYIGWLGAYVISIRAMPSGMWFLLLVFLSVWMADFGGYVIGIPFGRYKMNRKISPKKSWEGYIGGILMSLAAAYLFCFFVNPVDNRITLKISLLVALAISVLSLFGDLAESMLKRQTGVKDSGNLLPGHGGVFDRIDSWLWASVIGFYLIAWMTH